MLHIVGVDVVSLQQTTVAGSFHGELKKGRNLVSVVWRYILFKSWASDNTSARGNYFMSRALDFWIKYNVIVWPLFQLRGCTSERETYQLFQVLFGEPRIAIPLLLEFVPRRLCNHGYFLWFKSTFRLRWAAADWGVEEPRRLPVQQADGSITHAQQAQHRTASHIFKWPSDQKLSYMSG